MSVFASAVRKDLLRLSQDPLALLLWLGIPLVIGMLVTLAMGGSGGMKPKAKLLVADHDESLVSQFLIRALGSQGADGVVEAEEVEEEAGRARIAGDDGSALLVIPDGFGNAILAEDATKLELLTNPSQRILPAILREMLEILVDGTFYLHRIIGPELEEMTSDIDEAHPPTEADIARVSISIHHVVERIEAYLFPPVIELEYVSAGAASEAPSTPLALLFFPGIIAMALFFAAQGSSEDIWRERNQGILRRLSSTPHSAATFLMAKCAANAVVLAVISTFILAIGMLYHGIPLTRLPLTIVWSTLTGVLLLAMMLALQLSATSQRAGSILTNSILFPMLMLGGSFIPMDVMPAWMATLGRYTPNGWAVGMLTDLLLGRAEMARFLLAVGIFAAACTLLLALSARRVRSGFASGS